jgi:hypothetical protein
MQNKKHKMILSTDEHSKTEMMSYLNAVQLSFILSKELDIEIRENLELSHSKINLNSVEEGYYLYKKLQKLDVIELSIQGKDADTIKSQLSNHFNFIEDSLKPENILWIETNPNLKSIESLFPTMDVYGYIFDATSFHAFGYQQLMRWLCHDHFFISYLLLHIKNITAEDICAIFLLNELNHQEFLNTIPHLNNKFYNSAINQYLNVYEKRDMTQLSYLKHHFQHIIRTKHINLYKDLSFDVSMLLY